MVIVDQAVSMKYALNPKTLLGKLPRNVIEILGLN